MDNSKLPVSRAALERVLARAAELQGAVPDDTEVHESLTEGQVVELGKEVGLSPQVIRQALAEERAQLHPVESNEAAERFLGPRRVSAQRLVKGTPARILGVLDRWMQRDQLMRVVRQRSDMIVWEPSRGFVSNVRRAFGNSDYALNRANDITATAVEVEDGQSLVRLEADFSDLRDAVTKQTVVSTVVGGAAATVAIVLNVMVPVAVLPIVVFGAGGFEQARRSHKHASERGLLTLQLLLDRIERGETEPPSLIRMIESALPR